MQTRTRAGARPGLGRGPEARAGAGEDGGGAADREAGGGEAAEKQLAEADGAGRCGLRGGG